MNATTTATTTVMVKALPIAGGGDGSVEVVQSRAVAWLHGSGATALVRTSAGRATTDRVGGGAMIAGSPALAGKGRGRDRVADAREEGAR